MKLGLRAVWRLAAAAIVILSAPAARAQGLFSFFEPSPQQIARGLADSGYEIRSALVRRGDVYVCDVRDARGGRERLVIDARTARIVERFPARVHGWRYAQQGDWGGRDRNGDFADSWNGRPRPPSAVPGGDASSPEVIYGISPDSPAASIEKPRVRTHVAKKPAPPVAKLTEPTPPPTTVAPAAEAPPAPPLATTTVQPQSPGVVEVKPEPPKPEAPQPAEAKPAEAAKPVAQAQPTAVAPTPTATPKPKAKALNDLPVTPLD